MRSLISKVQIIQIKQKFINRFLKSRITFNETFMTSVLKFGRAIIRVRQKVKIQPTVQHCYNDLVYSNQRLNMIGLHSQLWSIYELLPSQPTQPSSMKTQNHKLLLYYYLTVFRSHLNLTFFAQTWSCLCSSGRPVINFRSASRKHFRSRSTKNHC